MIKKPIISLSEIPDTIMALCLIFGIGSVFGLLIFASFEVNRARILEARETIPPQGEYFGNKFIVVKNPQKNSVIRNPVFISGMADVYEANVRIKIKEGDNILADTFLTADGTGGGLYDYKGDIAFSFPNSANGSMEIFEENPKNGEDINKIIIPVVFEDYSALVKWDVFEDNIDGYGFEYPSSLILMTNSEKEVVISHKVSYKHGNLCIDEENPETTLNDIVDFHASIAFINSNISNAILLKEGIANPKSEKVIKLEYDGKDSYYVDNTEGGCGAIHYFIELGGDKTIFIKRMSVPELKEHFEIYSSLKNIILPAREDYIFNHMMSSIRSID